MKFWLQRIVQNWQFEKTDSYNNGSIAAARNWHNANLVRTFVDHACFVDCAKCFWALPKGGTKSQFLIGQILISLAHVSIVGSFASGWPIQRCTWFLSLKPTVKDKFQNKPTIALLTQGNESTKANTPALNKACSILFFFFLSLTIVAEPAELREISSVFYSKIYECL